MNPSRLVDRLEIHQDLYMAIRRDPSPRLKGFAREMRRKPSDAECKLWQLLRDRRLGGFKFRRQAPIGGYIVDFFCAAASTVVELDGEQHADPDAMAYDEQRSERLAELGIRVLRFTSCDAVRDPESVGKTILRILMTGS